MFDINTTRQFYKIQLKATIATTDQSPQFSQTLQFDLQLNNGCLLDQISVTNSPFDYIYYLAEDTSTPAFVQGASKPQQKTW